MRTERLIYGGIILATVLTSCVETIVMDPEEKDLPVMVNCIISPDHIEHTLYLQYVKGKSEKEFVPVEDATVYITTQGPDPGTDTIFFHHVEGSQWKTSAEAFYKGKQVRAGKECFLTVELPGHVPIHAETKVPGKHYSIAIEYYPDDPYFQYGSQKEYENHTVVWFGLDHGKNQVETPPVWIIATKGKHAKSETRKEHYSYLATDHPLADNSNINGKRLADLHIDNPPDNPHAEPRWRHYINMRRLMPDLPLHDDFVRIEHLDTTWYHIMAGPMEASRTGLLDHFDFLFVSDELDEYLRCIVKLDRDLDQDLTRLYSTENVYSNIEGGVGIFGCYICDYLTIGI